MWEIREGDCREAMAAMAEASVDAIVTDPPYGLSFMGKDWDSLGRQREYVEREGYGDKGVLPGYGRGGTSADREAYHRRQNRAMQEWHEQWAREALRVLKPGGHLLAFGGTRTYHRLACAVEDAGFEIRDEVLSVFEATEAGRQFLASLTSEQLAALDKLGGGPLAWLYGSGFPKSLDVSKAIDRAAGAEREVIGNGQAGSSSFERTRRVEQGYRPNLTNVDPSSYPITAPATSEAEQWDGWGTALKPAHEPIVVARKPLSGTVATNVLEHGTGALNVDGCRIASGEDHREKCESVVGLKSNRNGVAYGEWTGERESSWTPLGRWPANVVLDEQAAAMLDEQSGETCSPKPYVRATERGRNLYDGGIADGDAGLNYGDTGGASRFFYCAKASAAERNVGLEGFEKRSAGVHDDDAYVWPLNGDGTPRDKKVEPRANHHPTVKPIALMCWLVRLVTPPGGLVLDPFAGSGSTGIAAMREGFSFIGIEQDAAYVEVARARIIGDAPLLNSHSEIMHESAPAPAP